MGKHLQKVQLRGHDKDGFYSFSIAFFLELQETVRRAGGIWNCSGQGICKDIQYLHLVICKHQGGIRRLGGRGRGGSVLGQQQPLHQHTRHDM